MALHLQGKMEDASAEVEIQPSFPGSAACFPDSRAVPMVPESDLCKLKVKLFKNGKCCF